MKTPQMPSASIPDLLCSSQQADRYLKRQVEPHLVQRFKIPQVLAHELLGRV